MVEEMMLLANCTGGESRLQGCACSSRSRLGGSLIMGSASTDLTHPSDCLCPLNPCAVAEFTLRHFPACALLRRHPVPPPRQFEPLLRAAAAVGASIDPSTSKVCMEQGRDTHLPTAEPLHRWCRT